MFVIPMAGESRRFADAGFKIPKYQLQAHGESVFSHAVRSFAHYFPTEPFLFVYRDVEGSGSFVRAECERLKIKHASFVTLDRMTKGQAETVALGLENAAVPDDEPIVIFNIDTFRLNYRYPDLAGAKASYDGYLEVVVGAGDNFSFVRPHADDSGLVCETSEKRPISNLCSTGLYHFRRSGDFRWAYANPCQPKGDAERKERYVAPLYNSLISRGNRIGFVIIEPASVISCGTPEEYEQVRTSPEIARRLGALASAAR